MIRIAATTRAARPAATTTQRRGPRALMLASLALLSAACSDAPMPTLNTVSVDVSSTPTASVPSPPPSPLPSLAELPTPPVLSLDDIPLMCGGPLTFGWEALDAIPGAERAGHPAAERLRQMMEEGHVPHLSGWRLVVLGDQGALFLVPNRDPEHSFWWAELGPADTDFAPVRWGECDIQPAFEGIEAARWDIAPDEQVGPDTMTFEASVSELGCASGLSPEGRIVGPTLLVTDESVTVIFGTKPLAGPQTCQAGPSVVVVVGLPEPLGDRQLLDGAALPGEPRK
jgi:hypothetical protein